MVNAHGTTAWLGLAAALVAVSVVVARITPAALLPPPERPFEGYGKPDVRVESRSYPRHATGADDVRTTIAMPPRRLVSQSWSTDEFLYAVVPPERVVGVSELAARENLSNVHELAKRHRPIVALDPEHVLRLAPDLVFTPAQARSDGPGLLRAAGIPVYRMYTMFQTLASIEAHIRLVGYLTGEEDRAELEARRFHAAIRRAASRKPAASPAPRVMGFGGVYSYGSDTLLNDILHVLGAENVAATHGFVGYDRVTDEHIVRWNPDWIVAGAEPGTAEQVRARMLSNPAIAATSAAQKGRLIVLEHHVFLPLSPFTTQLVEAISAALYGGGLS
jgi:iron complex transport system substrate-binding protein